MILQHIAWAGIRIFRVTGPVCFLVAGHTADAFLNVMADRFFDNNILRKRFSQHYDILMELIIKKLIVDDSHQDSLTANFLEGLAGLERIPVMNMAKMNMKQRNGKNYI